MVIQADYNDADYVTSLNEVPEITMTYIKGILDKYLITDSIAVDDLISILDAGEYDRLSSWFPAAPDPMEIHTIEEIIFYELNAKITLI